MKKVLTLWVSMLMFSMVLTGCGRKAESKVPDKEKPVELDFYIRCDPAKDSERIMEKANKIIEEKIGAHLNLVMIDSLKYAEKMNLMVYSNKPWDLCFTANWGGINFYENAQKGAYADLTELLPKLAPETYARIPEKLWDGVKVDGKIYASVNYQQWGAAQRSGFRFRKDLVEETGFDWKALKGKPTLEVLRATGDFIGESLKTHPDMIGWETLATYNLFANGPLYWNMEEIGDVAVPGWIRYEEPEKVINQFETEAFMEFCKIMRDWYLKGYVRKDGATKQDTFSDRKAGKFIAEFTTEWPDSVDYPENQNTGSMSMTSVDEAPCVIVSNTDTILKAGAGSNAAVAVNARSEHIEKAVELIELLNTDDELYKLIAFGEEGIDYEYDENGVFREKEGKYFLNYSEWQIGQSYSPDFNRAVYDRNESGEIRKQAQQIVYDADREAKESPLTGFVFDVSPVKTQIVTCASVIKEMIPALTAGAVDPETGVPEFLSRLKSAGVDDIIQEKQKQLDQWNLTK